MRRLLVIVFAFVTVGCSGRVESGRIEKDDRPPFSIDSTQPFRLEFGRGSGWDGLDTIKIDQTGRVVLHRMQSTRPKKDEDPSWEVARLRLPPEGVSEVLKAVESNDLLGLHKAYHADNIADGTQWVLWIKQEEREKSIYFNNNFPRAITAFAEQLDAILTRAAQGKVKWKSVPEREFRQHEKELWESIRR